MRIVWFLAALGFEHAAYVYRDLGGYGALRRWLSVLGFGERAPDVDHALGGFAAGGRPVAAILATPDGSWARIDLAARGGEHRVTEAGPQRLWAVVERAHQLWHALGRPGWSRFGVTATPTTQTIWVDRPDGEHRWTRPTPPRQRLDQDAEGRHPDMKPRQRKPPPREPIAFPKDAMNNTPPAEPSSTAEDHAVPSPRNGLALRPPTVRDVLCELRILHARCMAIIHDAEYNGRTIESPEFVDGLWEFAAALGDFGAAIYPHPGASDVLASAQLGFITGTASEDLTLRQLLILLMLRVLERVHSQTQRYASELGGLGEEAELGLLSGTALKGSRTVSWNARVLTAWNSDRLGLPPATIASKLGVDVDDVPRWVEDATTFVTLWPNEPPAEPS